MSTIRITKRLCIFGDSIARGKLDFAEGGWTNRVRRALEDVKDQEWSVYSLGISGNTTTSLLKRMQVEAEARKPEAIIVAIGVNDARYIETVDHFETPLPAFRENLKKILDIARSFTKNVTFLGITPVDESKTIPIPWRTDLYYTKKNVALYNEALEAFCKAQGVDFIPVFDLVTKDDLPDGLHPNPEGHAKIAEKVLEHFSIKL